MDISRSSTTTILYGGRSLLTPSHYLLRWTYIDTQVATYCICENIGNDQGPILLQVTETGTTIADPFDGEVQLASGNHKLDVWEQTSDTNLFPPDEDPDFSELVNVSPADLPVPPPVDPCLGCAGDTLCEEVAASTAQEVVDCVEDAGLTAAVQALICSAPITNGFYWRAIALGT